MRILLLTQYYAPEPAFKFADLARALVARGHDVQVVTGFPCYPHGKTYAGYRQRICQEETIDGALVTRVPQWPDHSASAIRRALYYLSFAASVTTIGWWKARPADVMLVYQSAMPTGLAARWLSFVKRTPYVLDVADLWPESLSATGMVRNRWVLSIVTGLMRFIYRGARRINVITAGYRENLLNRGVDEAKLSVIETWPAAGLFDPVPRDEQLAADLGMDPHAANIIYAGAMGPAQGLDVVLDAAELLRHRNDLRFIMVGDGVHHPRLEQEAKQRGLDNVRFAGRLTPETLQRLYPSAAGLLVHLKPNAMSAASVPSKTFAYMCSGRPVLMGCSGDASDLIARHRCGICFAPSDAQALADAAVQLASLTAAEREAMGDRGRQAYLDRYQSARQVERFEQLLAEVTGVDEPTAVRRAA